MKEWMHKSKMLTILLGLVLTACSSAGADEPVHLTEEENAKERLAVVSYLDEVYALADEYWKQSESRFEELYLSTAPDLDKKIIIEEEVKHLQEVIDSLEKMKPPAVCQRHQEVMLEYFRAMLAAQSALLQTMQGVKPEEYMKLKAINTEKLQESDSLIFQLRDAYDLIVERFDIPPREDQAVVPVSEMYQ